MMTPEELIQTIVSAGSVYAPGLIDDFVVAAREELDFARTVKMPVVDFPLAQSPVVQRPAAPDRYVDDLPLWTVFSAFVLHFLDPLAITIDALRRAKTFERDELARIVFPRGLEQNGGDELDAFDLERLEQDFADLAMLASDVGAEAFGPRFRLSDFLNMSRQL